MHYEGWNLNSRSYHNRNPGNLRASSHHDAVDADGYRVFPSFMAGYAALLNDLTVKFSGHSVSGIRTYSSLQDLLNVYAPRSDSNNPEAYARFVAGWLTVALGESVLPDTPLNHIWRAADEAAPKTGG